MAKLKKRSKTRTKSKKKSVTTKKNRTRYCRCGNPCRCLNRCECRKTYKKRYMRNRQRRTKRRQRGGSKKMLNSSNYPNPFPKGGPFVPGHPSNGLGKGFYYKNNTNPFLPNPKHVQRGGGLMDLAENLPGGSDVLDTWWKGSTNVKNLYQSWIGGKPYVSPDPLVQPAMEPVNSTYISPDIPKISKQSQLTAAAFK